MTCDPLSSPVGRTRLLVPSAIVALVLLLIALTAPRVFRAPLWGDELRTWRDGVEKPLADVLLWRHNPDHAPLGHLLARGGAAMVGFENIADQPWSLRLFPWLCALACVPAIWRLGRTVDSDAAGLLMAALLITDQTFAFQSTQARMYGPLLLSCIIALTAAVRLLSNAEIRLADAAALALAIATGLWAHSQMYAVLVPILVVGGVLTARPAHQRRGVMLLAAAAAGLLLATPSVLKLLSRREVDSADDDLTARPFAQLEDATIALTSANWLSGALIGCAIAGFVVIGRNRGRPAAWLLAAVIVTSLANLLIAARYRPVGFARYLIILEPSLWAGVAALGVELCRFARRTQRRPMREGIIVLTCASLAALCVYGVTRAQELLPPHPLAGPFRDALRAAMDDVRASRIASPDEPLSLIVVPKTPFVSYARVYGLGVGDVRQDEALIDAVATRVPRGRSGRPPSTPAQLEILRRPSPVTIVGVVPARGNVTRSVNDPITFAGVLAAARGLTLPKIPTPDGTLRVVVIKFDKDRVTVDDPFLPR